MRYFMVWGSCVVHSSRYITRHKELHNTECIGFLRYITKLAFDEAIEEGQEPELLLTDDWEVPLVYADKLGIRPYQDTCRNACF
jgi:hypothetical protein